MTEDANTPPSEADEVTDDDVRTALIGFYHFSEADVSHHLHNHKGRWMREALQSVFAARKEKDVSG